LTIKLSAAEPTISFEHLSKRYRVPHRRDRWGKGTLLSELGTRLRNLFRGASTAHDEVWALRDVSFSVARGEVVGLIGRNGAGKSTLLKVLTRITEPTSGQVVVRGSVTSLLEVGTGFHSELTGRENIFLYGAILGMETARIRERFDAIVAFSDVERFLDLPLKRYSSGMALRLAFAVASHLDHRILVVDEALSVGDAAFRAKCLARIEDAARDEGRTVLFVSHDLTQIRRLARRSVLLERGALLADGPTEDVLASYLSTLASDGPAMDGRASSDRLRAIRLVDAMGMAVPSVASGAKASLVLDLAVTEPCLIELELETAWGVRLASTAFGYEGTGERTLTFESLTLGAGPYRVAVVIRSHSGGELERNANALTFVVTPSDRPTTDGLVALKLE